MILRCVSKKNNLYYNVQCVSVCTLCFMKLKITKDQRGVRIEFSRTYQCHRNTGFPRNVRELSRKI